MEMGQWGMGHCQWPIDPWWWNKCAAACNFLFLVDIKKLLTHPSSPTIIITGGLILIHDILLSRLRGLSSTTRLVTCVGVMTMGHGSWIMWVMGQMCDGSHGSWVTKDDPFPSLMPRTFNSTLCTRSMLALIGDSRLIDSGLLPGSYRRRWHVPDHLHWCRK